MIKNIRLKHTADELSGYIDRFSNARILVVGDIILDKYIWGEVSRISPEAPVPVVEIKDETERLGGAANVVNNIVSLGGKSWLCGIIGDDISGKELLKTTFDLGIDTSGIITDSLRHTSVKTRVVAFNQQVVRFDKETKEPLGTEKIEEIIKYVKKRINDIDAVIVADYGKGVVSARLMQELTALTSAFKVILAVDPKPANFEHYSGIDIMTPNHHEAGAFSRIEITNEASLERAGAHILNTLNCRSVLITQGKDGMTLFEEGSEPCHIPTVARKVFDVSGAGDTVIGAMTLALASGMDRQSAAVIANYAAGIVVGEVGTSVVTAKELKNAIGEGIDK